MKYNNKNLFENVIERITNIFKKNKFSKILLPLIGVLSLIWFLVRVIPKPVRASYPCMRIAFPLASGFIIWLTGLIASLIIIIKSYKSQFKYFIFSSIIFFIIMYPNNTVLNASKDKIYSSKSPIIGSNNLPYDVAGNSEKLVNIGFVSSENEPSDYELKKMVDEVIRQSLGEKGLSAIIKPGYKVVIKVNLVAPQRGAKGEKGRGIITDPRIVRYVAEKAREIIGFEKPADLKVIDGLFYNDKNPSLKSPQETSFYYARLERTNDNDVNMEDICYDFDGDGILDGDSMAQLVNCDALGLNERYCTIIDEPVLGKTKIYIPKFLRTKEQANGEDDYCDIFIGLPIFKSHGFTGITGAIKLHYGLRNYFQTYWDSGRALHSGYGWGTGNIHLLTDYLIAMQKTRRYDFIIMDCLTGNRAGPLNTNFDDINTSTDYILTNSLLSGFDPVAIDTVEALFAGYNPEYITLLDDAGRQNLGINKTELININNFNAFYKQKIFLYNKYHTGKKRIYNYRSYPFQDRWGGAKLLNDFTPPVILKIDDPVIKKSNIYSFKYSAEDKEKNNSGLARIELLINGNVISYKINELYNGSIDADLKSFSGKTISYKIAIWDKALNCSLSEEKQFKVP